jgi:hypothetical protein
MIQKFLDGKKKYSAFVITLLAAVVPVFIQDPEIQKTVVDYIPTVAALIAGTFYIVTQGKIDEDKVKAQAANGSAGQAATAAPAATSAEVQAQPGSTAELITEPPPEVEFDVKAFHAEVMATAEQKYKELNPATIMYKARDNATLQVAQSMKQVIGFWNYYVGLATETLAWYEEIEKKAARSCGRSPEYWDFKQDFADLLQCQQNLYELSRTPIDWQKKLMPQFATLYKVGVLAGELLLHNR